MKPVFILSLPRSGSTLLQRVLSAHPSIASIAEPWILLPLASILSEGGTIGYSNYSNRLAKMAVRDLIAELPEGMDDYRAALRGFALDIYGRLCHNNEPYFLDKTPRYYLIADFIFDVFPDAKVIFLFRHPLDILSSVLTTFSGDRLAIHHAHVDLYQGPCLLHEAHQQYAKRAHAVRYEDIVADPETVAQELTSYLGLEFVPEMTSQFRDVRFSGKMGDKTGDRKYTGMSTESVQRWRSVLGTVVRRRFARHYVRRLGPAVLETFGVSLPGLEDELGRLHVTWKGTAKDLFWLSASWGARVTAANVVARQRKLDRSRTQKID